MVCLWRISDLVGVFVMLMVVFSCQVSNDETMSGSKIQIDFKGYFETGDWIEIDGTRFEHQITDTLGAIKATYDPFLGYANQEGEQITWIIPPSTVFVGLEKSWGQYRLNQGQMAYYFSVVFAGAMKGNNPRYDFMINEPTLFTGKVVFRKQDSSAINVRMSKNYIGRVKVMK